jgi:hypothetical protein
MKTESVQKFNEFETMKKYFTGLSIIVALSVSACTPTVQVAMPSEPITINLNVRIEHEIRVKVERELEDMFSQNSGLF